MFCATTGGKPLAAYDQKHPGPDEPRPRTDAASPDTTGGIGKHFSPLPAGNCHATHRAWPAPCACGRRRGKMFSKGDGSLWDQVARMTGSSVIGGSRGRNLGAKRPARPMERFPPYQSPPWILRTNVSPSVILGRGKGTAMRGHSLRVRHRDPCGGSAARTGCRGGCQVRAGTEGPAL